MGIYQRVKGAYRALAVSPKVLEAERKFNQAILDTNAAGRLTKDITKLIPQAMDLVGGLLRDTDDLQEHDPEAYDKIFDDDKIATCLDNAFLPVGQAGFFFQANNPESKKLIPFLTDHVLDRPGWIEMIQDMCYAEVTGTRLARMVWQNEGSLQDPVFNVKQFTPKDKRRFRPGDTEWENIYLIDDGRSGTFNTGSTFATQIGEPKRLIREHFIVHRWRNTEDRNGWGKGIATRLYRLSQYRIALIHLFLQALENMGGGLRYVESDGEKMKGYSAADFTALTAQVAQVLDNSKSGDTVVLPPGFKATLYFPPNSVGEALQRAVDEYIDAIIEQTIEGIDSKSDQSKLGSTTYGKEMSKVKWRRLQFRATAVTETLNRDYIPEWARNNPWVWDAAGVPYLTKLPTLKVMVPGGEALKERAEVVNQSKVSVMKSEYYEAHGLTEVTQEDIDNGLAFTKEELAAIQPDPMAINFGDTSGQPAGPDIDSPEPRDVEDSAMNGAQVTSLVETLAKVTSGEMAPDAAIIMIPKAYPTISTEEATEMVEASAKQKDEASSALADDPLRSMLGGRNQGTSWAMRSTINAMLKGQKNGNDSE